MYNLQLSHDTHDDLAEIKGYIASDLSNPTAAVSVVKKITQRIRQLQTHPLMGASIASITDANSDERFLVSGKYLIFYRLTGNVVYIDRVLYGGRDYLRVLFEESLEEE